MRLPRVISRHSSGSACVARQRLTAASFPLKTFHRWSRSEPPGNCCPRHNQSKKPAYRGLTRFPQPPQNAAPGTRAAWHFGQPGGDGRGGDVGDGRGAAERFTSFFKVSQAFLTPPMTSRAVGPCQLLPPHVLSGWECGGGGGAMGRGAGGSANRSSKSASQSFAGHSDRRPGSVAEPPPQPPGIGMMML